MLTWLVDKVRKGPFKVPRQLKIADRVINDDSPAYIIAEIGHNHAHEMWKAKAMVLSAKQVGVSAVKFQTRHPKEVYSVAEYNRVSDNPNWLDRVYGLHREKLEFSRSEWFEIRDFCQDNNVPMISTPFDFKSVDLLAELEMPVYKIASGDATNIPMIEYVAMLGKPLLVSTGGCTLDDVRRVYDAVMPINQQLALLQCACVYPAPSTAMNLRVIETYHREFPECVIGLSSHHPNWAVNIAAYTLGARIFENHFTNDRAWKGTDNAFSLDMGMMRAFVDGVHEVREALGTDEKFPTPIEVKPTIERRKKLVAARRIAKGKVIERDDLAMRCPGDGIPPFQLRRLIGERATVDIEAETDISAKNVSNAEGLARAIGN